MKMNKRGFEFSFGWIFAIIIGAVIIFLAIYAATRLVDTERKATDSEIAKQLGILMNPMETKLEDFKTKPIEFNTNARIYNTCQGGGFGKQKIAVATQSGIGKKWDSPGANSTFVNNYLFSPKVIEGKNFMISSVKLEMPFKIADLMIIWSDKMRYCFVNPPGQFEKDIKSMMQGKINPYLMINNSVGNCKGYVSVCFSGQGGCNVSVYGDYVIKNGQNMATYGLMPLTYAAIFSEKEIYDCQIKRVVYRAGELASLYGEKSAVVAASNNGCSSALQGNLASYKNEANNFISEGITLNGLISQSKRLEVQNEALTKCKLF